MIPSWFLAVLSYSIHLTHWLSPLVNLLILLSLMRIPETIDVQTEGHRGHLPDYFLQFFSYVPVCSLQNKLCLFFNVPLNAYVATALALGLNIL